MATFAAAVEQVYNNMVNLGFFTYFLPWLLAFIVIYGILRSVDIFDAEQSGTDNWHSRLYGLMAAIIATLIVAYTPFQTGAFAAFLSTYFGSIALILLVLVGFVLVYGMITGESPQGGSGTNWVMWAVGLTVLFLLFSSGFFGMLFPGTSLGVEAGLFATVFANPSSVALLIIAALIIAALYVMFFPGNGNEEPDG